MTPYYEQTEKYEDKPSPHQLALLEAAWDMAVYDSRLDVYVKWETESSHTLLVGLLPRGYPPPSDTVLTIEAHTGYVRYYDKRFKPKAR